MNILCTGYEPEEYRPEDLLILEDREREWVARLGKEAVSIYMNE